MNRIFRVRRWQNNICKGPVAAVSVLCERWYEGAGAWCEMQMQGFGGTRLTELVSQAKGFIALFGQGLKRRAMW